MRRVCGNSTLPFPPWVGATNLPELRLLGQPPGECFAMRFLTERRGGATAPSRQLRDYGTECSGSVFRLVSLTATLDRKLNPESCSHAPLAASIPAVDSARGGPPGADGGLGEDHSARGAGGLVSFLLAVLLGPRLIGWLRRRFPRADQERFARRLAACTKANRPRPPWAACSSSPGWSAARCCSAT